MHLDPVYLVAPKPKPKSMTSRRAFLGMGLAFTCGGAIGSACGYSVGRSSTGTVDAGAAKAEEDVPLTGNADHDEVRRLAVKAPIDELMAVATQVLGAIDQRYATDTIVWKGVDRIVVRVLEHQETPNRRLLARFAEQVIQRHSTGLGGGYTKWISQLQAVQ